MKTEKNKNLYIIGFEHLDPLDVDKKDKKPCMKIELNTFTYADLIKIIGERQKITRFFSDGVDKKIAKALQWVINYMSKLNKKSEEIFIEKMMEKFPQFGQEPRIYQSLAYLKKSGIDIKVCQTEVDKFDKPLSLLEDTLEKEFKSNKLTKKTFQKSKNVIGGIKSKLKKRNITEFEFLLNNLDSNQFRLAINMRDDYMYQNFLKYSEKENLLGIGRSHLLIPFVKDKQINFYRVDILVNGTDSKPKDITLKGKLPLNLKLPIDEYLDKYQIFNKISYKE